MLIARKLALSLLTLVVAFTVLLVIAYSFGLGYSVQNTLHILNLVAAAVWLFFTWRGRWVSALIGIVATLVVGVVVVPFLSR
jgi:hypothetical protein